MNQSAAVGATPPRAVAPTPAAPVLSDRPPQPAPVLNASAVALAPVTMSALIEAQEYMSGHPSILALVHTAEKIDHLISRLDDGDPPPPPPQDAPLAVRRLQTARAKLF